MAPVSVLLSLLLFAMIVVAMGLYGSPRGGPMMVGRVMLRRPGE
jgi:hypothetical protein